LCAKTLTFRAAAQQNQLRGLLFFALSSAITPPFAARLKGCRGGDQCFQHNAHVELMPVNRAFGSCLRPDQESQMPKIKTKSGAKKRFKITGTGKVMAAHAGKRHGMIKRTKKQIRQLRGTNTLFKTDGENIVKYWLPNG
jgi:large subunit ribosomal protein L35